MKNWIFFACMGLAVGGLLSLIKSSHSERSAQRWLALVFTVAGIAGCAKWRIKE